MQYLFPTYANKPASHTNISFQIEVLLTSDPHFSSERDITLRENAVHVSTFQNTRCRIEE